MKIFGKYLSMDIGASYIKILRLKRTGTKIAVLSAYKVRTPEKSFSDGVILDFKEISQAIKKCLEENKIREKRFIVVVNSTKVLLRQIETPKLDEKKLRLLIESNSSDYLPININDHILDYEIIEEFSQDQVKKLRLNLFAMPKKLYEQYMQIEEMIKLKLLGIDYAGNSLTNILNKEKIEGLKLVIAPEPSGLSIAIVDEGRVVFFRKAIFGLRQLSMMIMSLYGVDEEEAFKLMCENNFFDPKTLSQDHKDKIGKPDEIADIFKKTISQSLAGVTRHIEFYTSKKDKNVDGIILIGDDSKIKGLADQVEEYFSTPTLIGYDYSSIKLPKSVSDKDLYAHYTYAVGANIGRVNLLPYEFKNRDKIRSRKRIPVLLLSLLVAGLALIYSYKLKNYQNILEENFKLEAKISAIEDIEEIKASHDEILSDYEFRDRLMEESKSQTDKLLDIIYFMHEGMPRGATNVSLQSNDQGIIFQALARDKRIISSYISFFKELEIKETDEEEEMKKVFSKVYVPSIEAEQVELEGKNTKTIIYKFRIQCDYNKAKEVVGDEDKNQQ